MVSTYLDKLNQVYNKLQDDESQMVFEARLKYIINRNVDAYEDVIAKLYSNWRCVELEEKVQEMNPKGIVIYGCGHDGRRTKKHLDDWGYAVDYFCDRNNENVKLCEGIDVLSVDEMIEKHDRQLVIIASSNFGKEMYHNLIEKGFAREWILFNEHNNLIATHGKQYFDVLEAEDNEVFVDCGSFDGEDIINFLEWTKEKYDYVYSFEPMKNQYEEIVKRCEEKNIGNISVMNNAVWNQKESLHFEEGGAGSYQLSKGKHIVEAISLDEVLYGKRVTYIKMDIEGSEMKALEGAAETIRSNKPKLAICIYHKGEDICDIGAYILELVPEYKFKIRHYASNTWETVLYAYI